MLNNPFSEEILSDVQFEPPLAQLEVTTSEFYHGSQAKMINTRLLS